jgi:hypothetical protein
MVNLMILAACLAGLVAITHGRAHAQSAADVLPDLVSDPVEDVVLTMDDGRLLLRFAGFVHNRGSGPLEISGSRASGSTRMTVTQRILLSSGTSRSQAAPAADLIYETADGHNHWHLMRAARYSLWNSAQSAEVAPATKVGFCLEDTERIETTGPSSPVYRGDSTGNRFCESNRPNATSLVEGISAGWRDEYHNRLAFQWVDVSEVQPGVYWLHSEIDPQNVLVESDDSNQAAWASSSTTIPGFVARPVDGGETDPGESAVLTLAAERFGGIDAGRARFRIESEPSHGSLDVPTGTSRQSATVVYTPDPGFQGTDSFTYTARDVQSTFPRSPAVATVTLRVGAPPPSPVVQISGAPDSMLAGTSVQLQATVTNDAPGVSWSADGGSITGSGLFTAPMTPPADGDVRITARSAGGGRDERTVRITPAPDPRAAPLPGPAAPKPDPASGDRLTRPQAVRIGRRLILTVRPLQAGVVRLTAYAGKRRLGSCRALTPAGRQLTCRLRIRRPLKPKTVRIRVVASLRINGRIVAVRTRAAAPVGTGHAH